MRHTAGRPGPLIDRWWLPGRAERKVSSLNSAYEILSHPSRRAQYDAQLGLGTTLLEPADDPGEVDHIQSPLTGPDGWREKSPIPKSRHRAPGRDCHCFRGGTGARYRERHCDHVLAKSERRTGLNRKLGIDTQAAHGRGRFSPQASGVSRSRCRWSAYRATIAHISTTHRRRALRRYSSRDFRSEPSEKVRDHRDVASHEGWSAG